MSLQPSIFVPRHASKDFAYRIYSTFTQRLASSTDPSCELLTNSVLPPTVCAGQDLIELGSRDPKLALTQPWVGMHPPSGFAGISRRTGKKPIIAAVNGFALGGGFEIVLNWYAFPYPSAAP